MHSFHAILPTDGLWVQWNLINDKKAIMLKLEIRLCSTDCDKVAWPTDAMQQWLISLSRSVITKRFCTRCFTSKHPKQTVCNAVIITFAIQNCVYQNMLYALHIDTPLKTDWEQKWYFWHTPTKNQWSSIWMSANSGKIENKFRYPQDENIH